MTIASAYTERRPWDVYPDDDYAVKEVKCGEFRFFAEQALLTEEGSVALDIATCGGRIPILYGCLKETRARFSRIIGLDASRPMLRHAQKAARAHFPEGSIKKVSWVEGDMRNLPFRGTIDLITIAFCSFFYNFGRGLPEDASEYVIEETAQGEAEQCLRAIITALKPGGRFIVDAANQVYKARNNGDYTSWWQEKGDRLGFRFKLKEPYVFCGLNWEDPEYSPSICKWLRDGKLFSGADPGSFKKANIFDKCGTEEKHYGCILIGQKI